MVNKQLKGINNRLKNLEVNLKLLKTKFCYDFGFIHIEII